MNEFIWSLISGIVALTVSFIMLTLIYHFFFERGWKYSHYRSRRDFETDIDALNMQYKNLREWLGHETQEIDGINGLKQKVESLDVALDEINRQTVDLTGDNAKQEQYNRSFAKAIRRVANMNRKKADK